MKNAAAFAELVKPRPTTLATVTAFLGFCMGAEGHWDWRLLLGTLAGCFAVGGGAAGLNQFFEAASDAKMKRTEIRPLPSGRLRPREALVFSATLAAAGLAVLLVWVNPLSAAVAALMLACYAFLYTPLKKKTVHSAWVGAVAGALPPVLGWTGAANSLGPEPAALFFLLFFWQFPHILAIGWIYRDDYAKGGVKVFAERDADGRGTVRWIGLFSAALLAVSFMPVAAGISGRLYSICAFALGAAFLGFALFLKPQRLDRHIRRFALASVIYLPALILFMFLDRIFFST